MGPLKPRSIEDEFEETLSLIDLPITPISTHDTNSSFIIPQETQNSACFKTEQVSDEEQSSSGFDFGSARFEMSSADELFLHGQILPLRLSVDSSMTRVTNPCRPDSVSESRSSSVEFGSNSRSSSYSSSTSSVNGNNVVRTLTYQAKIRNQFHAHPSPTPRLRYDSSNVGKIGSNRCRKSSAWDVFRLGPVQPHGIELKDLKSRHTQNPNVKTQKSKVRSDIRQDKNSKLKQRMFGLGSVGCGCTADAVENVRMRDVVIKSVYGERRRSDFKEGEIEEELKRKMEEERLRRRKEEVEVLPGRRTFEWLKQLSVEGDVKYGIN